MPGGGGSRFRVVILISFCLVRRKSGGDGGSDTPFAIFPVEIDPRCLDTAPMSKHQRFGAHMLLSIHLVVGTGPIQAARRTLTFSAAVLISTVQTSATSSETWPASLFLQMQRCDL